MAQPTLPAHHGVLGLEHRIQRAAFALATFLVVSLGMVTFITQATSTHRERHADRTDALKIVANDIRLNLNSRVDTLAVLSESPLIWTAISDSMGRDAYLRPFLASLNASGANSMRMTLFDYKGRWIAGDRSILDVASAQLQATLTAQTVGDNQTTSTQVTLAGEPHMLIAFPVHYTYTNDVIGVLVGTISLTELVKTRLDNLPSRHGFSVMLNNATLIKSDAGNGGHYQVVAESVSHPQHPELYRMHIELFGVESPWVTLLFQLGAFYLLTSVVLIWGIWRTSGLLARKLTRRLNQLSVAVSGVNRPRAEDIPIDQENDEISQLAKTLRSALAEQARITAGLETLVTERTRDLAESQTNLKALFELSPLGIALTDLDGRFLEFNAAFLAISGHSAVELSRLDSRALTPIEYRDMDAAQRKSLDQTGRYGPYEKAYRQKTGHLIPVRENGVLIEGKDAVMHVWSIVEDITEQKNHLEQLEHIAHFDALTGLPNRILLADRLHLAMAQAQRRQLKLAVVYLDLDGFKAVNDTLGHQTGDEVLVSVSARMQHALRESDTLARLGGDEFVAVLADLSDIEASVPILVRLLAAASLTTTFEAINLGVTASIGVTFFPQIEEVDADQLLRQADQAMYQAKLSGKNRYHVFDSEQDRNIRGHHESLERIRLALTEHEFLLYYQPKVNMSSGKIIGAEALIRWQHPQRGLLSPAVFLPFIADHPLAIELGEWVINSALTQMEIWRAAGLNLPVSINIDAYSLQQPNFMERLRSILAAHPSITPGNLELEVLETSALEDIEQVSKVIHACQDIGVNFALDDFGTGYSSLTYLKRLPATCLKIDQSFVRDMLEDPDDMAILEGVLGLSQAFRREAIAEGVETIEHGVLLLQLGYELGQGYAIAYPMPAHKIPAWAATWQPDPAWKDRRAISRDDLSVLYASVEHRAWIAAVDAYFDGRRAEPPILDHLHCRFGKWLHSQSQSHRHNHGDLTSTFQRVETLHAQIHTLVLELLDYPAQGLQAEVKTRMNELHDLRDNLLEQLKLLVVEHEGYTAADRRATGGAATH